MGSLPEIRKKQVPRCAGFFLGVVGAEAGIVAVARSAATAASKDGQKAISKGVLVLVLPPAGFMTVGVALAFYYGKKRDLENG